MQLFEALPVEGVVLGQLVLQIVLLPDEALLAPPEAAVTLGGGPVPEQLRPEQCGVARDVAVGDTAVLQQRQGQCYVICICQTSGFLSFKA